MEEGFNGHDYAATHASKTHLDNGDMLPVGNDKSYGVEFYMGKVPNFEGTDYEEVPHLRLRLAGQNDRVYDQPVIMDSNPARPSDPERFPRQWAAFQRGELYGETGTLLVDWDRCEPGDVRRLELQGITTVEQLANVGEHQLHGLGAGSRILRDAAREHMTGGGADAEKEVLREQMAAQSDQLTKMGAILQGLMNIMTPEQQAMIMGNAGGDPPPPAKPKPQRQAAA